MMFTEDMVSRTADFLGMAHDEVLRDTEDVFKLRAFSPEDVF